MRESGTDGDTDGNFIRARACVRDSLLRGEAPIASHLLYTQPGVLGDNVAGEREPELLPAWRWDRSLRRRSSTSIGESHRA